MSRLARSGWAALLPGQHARLLLGRRASSAGDPRVWRASRPRPMLDVEVEMDPQMLILLVAVTLGTFLGTLLGGIAATRRPHR